LPSKTRLHDHPVEVTAPAVPADDQRPDQRGTVPRDQQRVGISTHQRLGLCATAGEARRSALPSPETDDVVKVFGSRAPDLHALVLP
jgi:hypothetical protein